jgi:hypothetical protein
MIWINLDDLEILDIMANLDKVVELENLDNCFILGYKT